MKATLNGTEYTHYYVDILVTGNPLRPEPYNSTYSAYYSTSIEDAKQTLHKLVKQFCVPLWNVKQGDYKIIAVRPM